MSTTTDRLELVLPDGNELVDVQTLNANWSKLDLAAGVQIVTSATRPSSPFPGKLIAESDTGYRTFFSKGTSPADSSWVEIPNSSATFGAPLTLGDSLTVGGDLIVHGVGQTRLIDKPVTTSRSSTTAFADDPHLTATVVAGTYDVEFVLAVTGTDGDIKTTWAVPEGTVGLKMCWGPTLSSTDREATLMVAAAHNLPTTRTYGVNHATNGGAILEKARIVVPTPGNVTLQWAQNSSSDNPSAVLVHSYMVITRYA